jgi:hypothetical protein
MARLRAASVTVALAVAVMLVSSAGTASAQTPAFTKKMSVTGVGKNGKPFTGTYKVKRFIASDGEVWAVGRLAGKLGKRPVVRRGVMMPAALQTVASVSQQPPPIPTPGACPVLNLVLGPIDLNLLGLRVATNQIRVLIEAIPGAGNLLGNLLCAVTNLLNPSAGTPLDQVVRALNALLALAPSSPAAGAARASAATAAP